MADQAEHMGFEGIYAFSWQKSVEKMLKYYHLSALKPLKYDPHDGVMYYKSFFI